MNVIDLLRKHGIEPKKASGTHGGEYSSACPGCGGDDRFRIWPEQHEGQGGYWCRQCGKKGDAIQFLRDFDGLSFRQACERLGRPVPDSKDLRTGKPRASAPDWRPRDPQAPGSAWSEHAKKLIAWGYEQLMGNDGQLAWLKARGIPEAAVVLFGLGWIPNDVYRVRESWGLPVIKDEKREGRPRPLWVPMGLVIPWFDGQTATRIRIRRPDPGDGPRYYMVPGSASATMLIAPERKELVRREVYVVVESELDAIMLHCQASDVCGAVALGSNSAHPDVAAAAILEKAAVILNALDLDAAGSSQREWWTAHFPQSKRWPAGKHKDPGDAYKAGMNIREWVIAGLPEGMRVNYA